MNFPIQELINLYIKNDQDEIFEQIDSNFEVIVDKSFKEAKGKNSITYFEIKVLITHKETKKALNFQFCSYSMASVTRRILKETEKFGRSLGIEIHLLEKVKAASMELNRLLVKSVYKEINRDRKVYNRLCSVPGCKNKVKTGNRFLCEAHYLNGGHNDYY